MNRGAALVIALVVSACAPSAPRAVLVKDAREAPAPSEPVWRYRIITTASNVSAIATATLGRYTLRIVRVHGYVDWVPRQPTRSRFVIEADMRSVAGSVDVVTRVVRNDFLHVERFPRAHFASSSFSEQEPGRGHVTGVLLLHGVQRRIEVPGRFRFAGRRLYLDSEFVIDRRDHAIESDGMLDALVHDDIVVRLALVAEAE